MRLDLLIKDGVLPDGTRADIAIIGDKIAGAAPGIITTAGQVMDATGKPAARTAPAVTETFL
jgi:cytosine deaminase